MSEVRFTESFLIHTTDGHVRTGIVTIESSVPISLVDYSAASVAIERVKANLHRLIAQQDVEPSSDTKPVATGEAVDPALITAKLPGVNVIDKRRGPRAGAKK